MDKRIMDLNEQVNLSRRILAESKWSDYCTGETNTDLTEYDRGVLAQLLENQAKHMAGLDEATQTASIGTFEKFIFPMIRIVWPNLVSQELVSVQPMDGPISMIFFLDFLAGSDKGGISKGDVLQSSRTGMREESFTYASEHVDSEIIATPAGGPPATSSATLSYVPVRPGSLTVTYTVSAGATTRSLSDDGNGNLVGSNATGTVNYTTGAVTLSVNGTAPDASSTFAAYDYNSEMSDIVPQLDASLASVPVVSRPEKIRARWSVEVAAQLKAVHGLDAEVELTEALAQQVRFGIDNRIINDLFSIASAGTVVFDAEPPVNIPYYTHQMGLIKALQSNSNKIFKATRRGFGNWIVCGVDAATVIESHPLFESSGNFNGPGVVFSGVFANRWKVFKNPFLANQSSYLVGYKGDNFFDAGYVFAPWIPFYQTPTITLDDMMFRKGILVHYGRKAVNGLFYSLGNILHA